ncbi:histone deacetylase 6-like [Oppia nitens]|uniref:histone deacetylase 6-like n=1 Tax=Oppia nitens TaxID=1686743 RepID=UPI0023DC40E1|nr:histone deacetylase 6-like [Oppia nitens]
MSANSSVSSPQTWPADDQITDESDLVAFTTKLTLNDSIHNANQTDNLRTGLVYYEEMSEHRCLWDDKHQENPKRFTETLKRFKELDLIDRCLLVNPRKATEDEVLMIHTTDYLSEVKSTQNDEDLELLEEKASRFDAIYFHPKTYELALYSAGSTIDLLTDIATGKVRNGFALVRPPGHHAMSSEACGYCFFNNVAIGAQHCLNNLGLDRILIVDWDVHHGQATQYSFYDDKRVLYFSVHRYESGAFWPELIESNFNHIGGNNAKGFNINVPLNETGMTNADYLSIWHNILLPIAYEFDPQMVIVSAGYDAAFGCPEGEMLLSPVIYSHLCHSLMSLANGKICIALEGGYCIPSLAESAAITLRTLIGDPCPLIEELPPIKDSMVSSVLDVISALRPYWKCLKMQGSFDRQSGDPTNNNRQHLPIVEYKGKMALMDKPVRYPTRGCCPVQDADTKQQILNEINRQKAITDLSPKFTQHRTCIVYDDQMERHKSWSTHPERPSRTKFIFEKLKSNKLFDKCLRLESRSATDDEISLVHTREYIDFIKSTEKLSEKELWDLFKRLNFTYIITETYKAAKLAVGNVLQVVDSVLSDQCLNGFACVRPPGHHSSQSEASGFCVFNNVAIAANYAISKYGRKRVLILDWDIHHGNGTQKIFDGNDKVLFISLHRYDYGKCFPKSPKADYNIGKHVVNIPWNDGPMSDSEYLLAFFNVILPVAYNFNPDVVFISAGFDSAINDPLGEYKLSPQMFGHMTHMMSRLANGKLIVCLEGGYNIVSNGLAASQCLSVLLGNAPESLTNVVNYNESAIKTLKQVIAFQSTNWTNLRFDWDLPEN